MFLRAPEVIQNTTELDSISYYLIQRDKTILSLVIFLEEDF